MDSKSILQFVSTRPALHTLLDSLPRARRPVEPGPAPLLAARYRLARMANPLPACDHVDLLHPVRRRYRGRWENCRLATIERRVLGIVREDDLPGSEAPAAWLRYLRGGSARDLRRVADHNRQDLVSLAGVWGHLVATEDEVSHRAT